MDKEKYFPHGFIDEHPDVELPRRPHKVGALDICSVLIGIFILGLCIVIFYLSDGLALIRQFLGGDMGIILEHIEDVRFFGQNLDITWRLYYEVAAFVILLLMATVAAILVHCFVKRQAAGVIKAVLLLMSAFGMVILSVGYFFSYLITVSGGMLFNGGFDGLAAVGGIAMAAAAGLWFIYMLIWGFASFFKNFHVAVMALLSLGFGFSFLLMIFHLVVTHKVCGGMFAGELLYQLMAIPVVILMFMLLSFLASVEDFLAKRVDWKAEMPMGNFDEN